MTVKRSGLILVLATSVAVLGACAKKEKILTGKRESIDAVLADATPGGTNPDAQTMPATPPALTLPAARQNAEWRQRDGSPATRATHPALRSQVQLAWSVDIGEGDGKRQRITADPVVAGGRVFTLDSTARVSAVSAQGQMLWSVVMEDPSDPSAKEASGGGLAYGDGKLFVSLGYGALIALDPKTGAVLWRQELGGTGSGSPAVKGKLVYMVSGDEVAWAVDTDTGRIRWQLTATKELNNVISAPAPAVTDKYVIFPFGSGELQGALRKGGLQLWQANLAGKRKGVSGASAGGVTGDPLVVGDKLYAGTSAGRTVALELGNGQRLWTAKEGPLNPIWPAGGSLFMINDRNELLRLSASDGGRLWAQQLPVFVSRKPRKQSEIVAHMGPVIAGGRVIVASNDGLMRFFNPETGAPLGQVQMPAGATTDPVVAGGTLYVVTTKGQLLAYR